MTNSDHDTTTPYKVTGLDPDHIDLAELAIAAHEAAMNGRGEAQVEASQEQGWLFNRYMIFALDRDTTRTRVAFRARFGLDEHTTPQHWFIETARALSAYTFAESGPYVVAEIRDTAPEGTLPLGLSTYVAELKVHTWFDRADQFHVWVPNTSGGGTEAHTLADIGGALQALRDAR